MSTFESLPNALFINLLEYFNVVHLLRSFACLNRCFDSLLFDYYRTYRLDFRSILNEEFDDFGKTYFPLVKSQIIYLRLSDDDETPFQSARLRSDYGTFGKFDNLRSLSLHKLGSDQTITQDFFVDFHCLRHSTHLKLVDCSFFHLKDTDFQRVIDQIWSLPQLTHLYWDCRFQGTSWFRLPKCVSTSLQCLTINHQYWCSNNFAPLFAKTPRLRKFSVELETYEEDDLPVTEKFVASCPHLPMRKVFLSQVCSRRLLTNLVHFLPNVTDLKIESPKLIGFDGHQWEHFLVKSFPQLKVFQLKMNLTFSWDKNHRDKFDRYFSTYRTSFWIERRWFIRFHWGMWMGSLSIYLYSLPYAFNVDPVPSNVLNLQTKSTCPDANSSFSSYSIRQIDRESWLFKDRSVPQIQLKNIEQLSVELPFDSRFFSIVPTLCNLRSLVLDKLPSDCESELQEMLDHSPRLEEVAFCLWKTLRTPPYRLESSSIHRLDLGGWDEIHQRNFYTSEQCLELVQSPLGRQCRVLTIRVNAIKSLFILTLLMPNLRTLYLQADVDTQPNADVFIKDLKGLLPKKWRVNRASFGALRIQS